MQIYQDRPYVICHMLSSLDGKIDGDYFQMPELQPVRKASHDIRARYNCNAVLCGAVTAAEIYPCEFLPMRGGSIAATKEPYIADPSAECFAVVIDPEGGLRWESGYVERPGQAKSHVIQVLTECVTNEYLTTLRNTGVSYIFAGKNVLDAGLALRELKLRFGIDTLILSGGGVVNWTFLQAGLIDELSLVICPLTDGQTDTAAVFSQSKYLTRNIPVAFALSEVEPLPGDGIWLKYVPKNINRMEKEQSDE